MSQTSPVSASVKEALHYLGAIKVRLELLYEHSTQDHRLLEQLSDEVDWVDAEIDRLRAGHAQTPAVSILEKEEAFLCGILSKGGVLDNGDICDSFNRIQAALTDASTAR